VREEKRPRFDQNRIEERAGVDTDLPISRRRDLYRRPRWRPERGPGILGAVCAMPLHKLPLAFEARGTTGLVSVRVWPNDDPPSVGKAPGAEGFPVCEATVSTDLAGYDALFGWVQLVGIERSSAAERQFEPDPLEILDDLDLPFGFYGVRPTLFDAPSRQDRQQQLDWLAHSFLCMSPGAVMERAGGMT
jgi:hypothetical protein